MDRILPWFMNGMSKSPVHEFLGWIMMTTLNAATLAAYVAGPLTAGLVVWKHFS